MFCIGKQVFGPKWNSLQRPAEPLAFDVAIDIFGRAQSWFAQREGQRIVAGAEALQPVAEGMRELDRGKFLGLQLLVDFGDAREENIVGNRGHMNLSKP